MEQKTIIAIAVGILFCAIMLLVGLHLTGQVKTVSQDTTVPAVAEVETGELVTGTEPTTDAAEVAISETTTTPTETTTTTTTTTTEAGLTPEERAVLRESYPENIAIVGDSIAYGFNAYGFLGDAQNFAQGSVAIRNIHDFTFTYNGTEMDILDALEDDQPAYIYMSMGMNDVNMTSSEEYGDSYRTEITSILERCPNSIIIAAGITPIGEESEFTDNATIREFNDVLETTVEEMDNPKVYYFDAYSVIADPDTQAMRPECSGGDGIHLSGESYEELLNAIYDFMDTIPVPEMLQ